ncbi:MAG TPA: BspA family leucine-rich repeat surface protein [Flavobacteriaceae bacterium]|nr:BspA family leucine-rich repeat surface protein [Flavobacteriaceae bacterium]
MKKFYFAFLFALIAFSAQAQQQPFITTWEVEPGDLNITIPTTGTGYNYTVDFGDGSVQYNVTGDVTHSYFTPGIYTVTISGNFPRIDFSSASFDTREQIKSIEQWGDIQWASMEKAFTGCSNMVINATDAPDLSQVTDISSMFEQASSFNQSINHWNVSNVTNMSSLFSNAITFNQPLNNWNVSNVTDMSSMFKKAILFDQPLNSWNVSNVTDMSYMFSDASSFNQPLNNWDVSNVTNMNYMFTELYSVITNPNKDYKFNQTLNNWNVSNVATMKAMFQGAIYFNQPLNNWDVSNVIDMSYMFQDAASFNQNVNNWNVSNVTDMSYMFSDTYTNSEETIFNQPLDNWDVSNVVNMKGMFSKARFFEQPLNSWDVGNVANMSGMFKNAINFNQPLNNWNVSNVTDMSHMFEGALVFNQDIGNWDVSNVIDMGYMFASSFYGFGGYPYHKFDQPIGNWNVSNVVNMEQMFAHSEFNQDINNWDVSSVTNMKSMFVGTNSFNKPLNLWNVSNVLSMEGMFANAQNFNQDLSNWNFNNNVSLDDFVSNTSLNITNYELLISRFKNLNLQNKNLDATGLLYCNDSDRLYLVNNLGWNILNDNKLINCTQNLTPGAFVTRWRISASDPTLIIPTTGSGYNYTIDFGDGTVLTNQTNSVAHNYNPGVYTVTITGSFPRIDFNSESQLFSVEQWGDIQWTTMQNAFSNCPVKINATDAPDLSQVADMSGMFSGCNFNQSINHWDVSNVTNMSSLFANMEYFNQPLDNWNVSNVTDMSGMFQGSTAFNQPLNSWDVSSVTDMTGVFLEAKSFNQPVDNWNVSNVTNMSSMFEGVLSFNQPLNNWDVSNVTDMSEMFSSAYYFNQPLNNWDVSNVSNIDKMFSVTYYFNQPLNNWDVSNITIMSQVFGGAKSFNQPLNNWDVSNVTIFFETFSGTGSFNQPLDNWDVSNAQSLVGMFWNAKSFNQPLNDWDVSNVTNMQNMFDYASSFNQPLDNWDVSNVNLMDGMFRNAQNFNQDLSSWDFNTGMMYNFLSDSGLDISNYNSFLAQLAISGINNGELGADGLEYCNQGARYYLINNLGWTIYGDNLSADCNMITGTILYDENNNGCNSNDITANGVMININDGTYDFATFVNNGNYNVGVAGTNFTVSVVNTPAYYTVTPPSAFVTFTTSNTAQQDFCLTANQSIEDINVTLLPISQARPGFEADYQLVVENMGTQSVATVTLTLSFDDTNQSFVSAVPSPTSTTANQLTFDLTNLLPFETRTIGIIMQTFTPPTVNGGDLLSFTTSVTPNTNDHTPADNTFVYDQTVVNSFDPNDKQVLQGEEIFISEADEYLSYLIRFQNTGTASAINVRILDTLHPKLDWNTIQPVSASHNYRVEITDGNHVEFIFENINLPHEAADEPGSHGFIAYKIKPKNDVQIGDIITGDARIYFDFNAPIITNMVSTEIVENLSAENFELASNIRLYPNPTNGILNISSETELEKVELFSITGNRLLLQENSLGKIDLHRFSEGIYFLKIIGENGTEVVKKIVKKE